MAEAIVRKLDKKIKSSRTEQIFLKQHIFKHKFMQKGD